MLPKFRYILVALFFISSTLLSLNQPTSAQDASGKIISMAWSWDSQLIAVAYDEDIAFFDENTQEVFNMENLQNNEIVKPIRLS